MKNMKNRKIKIDYTNRLDMAKPIVLE